MLRIELETRGTERYRLVLQGLQNSTSRRMAVAQQQWIDRMRLLLFIGPMLHLHTPIATITTSTSTKDPLINAGFCNNTSGSIDMNWEVRRLCKQGRLKEALHILNVMDLRGIRPGSSTYASLLHECINRRALSEGKLIHARMIDTGVNPEIFLGNNLVIMYAKCGSLLDARRVLEEMPQRNVVSWNVMIAAYSKHGHYGDALRLFYQMQRTGTRPDEFTLASVLPACGNLGALERGRNIHEDIVNSGIFINVFVGNALVDMYAKCGNIESARQVFDKMSERDVVSWNVMIAGYAQNGRMDEARKLFYKMPEPNVVSWNSMVAAYAQNGRVDEALHFFYKLPERNVVTWTAMIAGCAENGLFEESLSLFQKMPERNVVSWTAVVEGCAQSGHVDEALKLFQKIPERNVVSWTVMIAGYAQNAHVDEALKLFQKLPERNVVSWTAMIAGYAQNGHVEKALKLFRQMQLSGMKSVSDTFGSILPACANLSALRHGKEVHGNVIRSGFQPHMFVGSALVDMYAKCGSIEDACNVFDKMPERNVVSWNVMIEGYAMHGFGKEALQLFEQMQLSGMKPDHVTFVGVLSACCHAGLVDDGWQYFDRLSRDYHISPTLEHYGCMVDLLGRAGHLDEALDFINKMPMKPSAVVWGSLLGACRIHTNIELGECVAEHLFELEPKNAANYVLLSNIYAAAGRWDDVEKVQKLRKDGRIKKSPGCSWIEVNNKVYSFLARDRSQSQMREVYAELERLSGKMKEAGYMPDTNLVLHDVEEEQKENILFYHSKS